MWNVYRPLAFSPLSSYIWFNIGARVPLSIAHRFESCEWTVTSRTSCATARASPGSDGGICLDSRCRRHFRGQGRQRSAFPRDQRPSDSIIKTMRVGAFIHYTIYTSYPPCIIRVFTYALASDRNSCNSKDYLTRWVFPFIFTSPLSIIDFFKGVSVLELLAINRRYLLSHFFALSLFAIPTITNRFK